MGVAGLYGVEEFCGLISRYPMTQLVELNKQYTVTVSFE
jgi:hypothetical protein